MAETSLTREFLHTFMSKHLHAVISTVTADQRPEAAVVGIVVAPDLRIFFDTSNVSRKYKNLMTNPSIAVVIGWDHEQTAQVEGTARAPNGKELDELQAIYFQSFPDGKQRQSWPDIAYIVVDTKWVRYSDFNGPEIKEITF